MTPEERRELADRLVERAATLNERTAKVMGSLGRGWANTAADLRAAAAALREMPSTEEIVTAARASLWEQMESEAVGRLTDERDAALAEVVRLREGIEAHRRRVPTEQAAADRDLWALLDTEGDTDE